MGLLQLLAARGAVGVALPPALRTPDRTPYDPTMLLCQLGKDTEGKPKIQSWCKKWLTCIKKASQPKMDAAAVLTAWKPADCREVCGEWPVLKSPKKKAALLQQHEGGFLSAQSGASDC